MSVNYYTLNNDYKEREVKLSNLTTNLVLQMSQIKAIIVA